MIQGYKCFNEGLINRYGKVFEPGIVYHIDGEIKYRENGFHMCANLEDTLRYFDAINQKVDIAKVVGYGHISEYEDDYNEYYNMYATEYLEILKVLSRDEIIDYALKLSPGRVQRFISLYKLNMEEIALFKKKYVKSSIVLDAITYYQLGDNKVYQKRI